MSKTRACRVLTTLPIQNRPTPSSMDKSLIRMSSLNYANNSLNPKFSMLFSLTDDGSPSPPFLFLMFPDRRSHFSVYFFISSVTVTLWIPPLVLPIAFFTLLSTARIWISFPDSRLLTRLSNAQVPTNLQFIWIAFVFHTTLFECAKESHELVQYEKQLNLTPSDFWQVEYLELFWEYIYHRHTTISNYLWLADLSLPCICPPVLQFSNIFFGLRGHLCFPLSFSKTCKTASSLPIISNRLDALRYTAPRCKLFSPMVLEI